MEWLLSHIPIFNSQMNRCKGLMGDCLQAVLEWLKHDQVNAHCVLYSKKLSSFYI